MIDLHCHLLPGIDDGPRDVGDSLELARALVADGTRVAAATPHVRDDHPAVIPGELAARCAELQNALTDAGIPLEVVPGGELDFVRALESSDDDLRLASYGGRGTDLLLEAPYGPLATTFEDMLFGLQVRGYRILLAHPERNPSFREDPSRLEALVRREVLVQVTAMSLVASERESRSARLAGQLVKNGLAHVIASDAHGRGVDRATLSQGVEVARSLAGDERAEWMVEEAPAAVLGGEPLPEGPEPKPAESGLLRRFGVG